MSFIVPSSASDSSLYEPMKVQVSERDASSLPVPRSTLTLTFTLTSAKTMGDNWVVINIINSSTKTVVVENVRLYWGNFYKDSKSPRLSVGPGPGLVSSACVVVLASSHILTSVPV